VKLGVSLGQSGNAVSGYFLHVLVSDPWIAAAYNGEFLRPAVDHLARLANGAAAHLLVRPMWHAPSILASYADEVRELAVIAPNVRLTVATATAEDDLLFRAFRPQFHLVQS
jgi:hypothetical protein